MFSGNLTMCRVLAFFKLLKVDTLALFRFSNQ